MGTRADFYIGRGANAEWLGSTAWDGYPDGIRPHDKKKWPDGESLFDATTENVFRERLAAYFNDRRDVTMPSDGWPWPWNDSGTTDYAYAFDGGKVWASSFGCEWFDPLQEEPEDAKEDAAVFPDMSARKNVKMSGPGSGLIVVGPRGVE